MAGGTISIGDDGVGISRQYTQLRLACDHAERVRRFLLVELMAAFSPDTLFADWVIREIAGVKAEYPECSCWNLQRHGFPTLINGTWMDRVNAYLKRHTPLEAEA